MNQRFNSTRRFRFLILALVIAACLMAVPSKRSSCQAEKPAARWWKGNLHTHSLWSDGNDFPEMICDWYKQHDYHFLALSDHNILSRGEKWIGEEVASKRGAIDSLKRYQARFGQDWVETREKDGKTEIRLKTLDEFRPLFDEAGRFVMIQGEEITDHYHALPIHINASNIKELIRPQGGDSVRETIANNLIAIQQQSRRVGQPILAHLNHPNYGYAVTAEDMAAVVEEQFFEVYNGHPSVGHRGDADHASVERMWDIANTIRLAEMNSPPLFGLATDDSHNYFGNRGSSPGRGWVMVRTAELDPHKIIHALMDGHFYASSGVMLSDVKFDRDRRELRVSIAAEDGVTYTTEFVGTPRDYNRESTEVVDKEGKPIRATRRYSADVGKVLATMEGPNPTYQLTGDELYVRAVITSSEAPENPAFDGQRQQAWTQPVGWNLKKGQ